MKTKKYVALEARRLLKQEESSITKSNGCLPEWPRYEIRLAGNPPRHLV